MLNNGMTESQLRRTADTTIFMNQVKNIPNYIVTEYQKIQQLWKIGFQRKILTQYFNKALSFLKMSL